tara:strand:+ start:352 stop:645 length:294 start_codon:yes stop_codon:yes gene_type:complete
MKQGEMITCFCGGDYHPIINKRSSSLSCILKSNDEIALYCYEDIIAQVNIDTNEIIVINKIDYSETKYRLLCKIKRELLDLSINYTCKNDFNVVEYD